MLYPEQEKKDESKTPNLLQRSGVYYFYCRIPSHLQHFFPHTDNGNFQKHIKRTLRTKIHDEAIERIIPFNAQYADLIKVLEVKTMPTDTVRQYIRAFGFKYPDDVSEPVQHEVSPKKAKKYLLSKLMDLYTNTNKDGWNSRTPRLVAHSLRLILYILGDIPVADIDRAKCRYVRDIIFKLPPDMFYHPLLKDIPIETALCQSALKFDPPSASKTDPPQVVFCTLRQCRRVSDFNY